MFKIKQDIHSCLDQILSCNIESEQTLIFSAYLNLIDLFKNAKLSSGELQAYFEDSDVVDYLTRARKFFSKWEMYLEYIMQMYFTHGAPPQEIDIKFFNTLRSYYIGQYRSLALSEIKAACINSTTRVCHVGVGSMPLSLLLLHKYSNKCSVVGIDCDDNVISAAQDCISHKCTLEPEYYALESFTIKHAEGANFNYTDFDVVILSSSITNKQQIVDQLKLNRNKKLLLIDRKISGLGHYIYQSSDFSIEAVELSNSEQFGLVQMTCYSLNLTE